MTGWVDEERAVDVVYLDFSKVFDTVSHNIFIGKFRKCGLDEWSVRWTENWLKGTAQRVVISSSESSSRPVTSDVPQGSILVPVLFNFFMNDLDEELECTLSKFVIDTKLGGMANTPEGCVAIHQDLNTWTCWRVGYRGTWWCSTRASAGEQLHAPVQAWGRPAVEQLCGEGPGCPGGWQVDHEPAVCLCCQEGQWDPEVH